MTRTIGCISFISQDNWIIGQTTDSNLVTLTSGDSANVTASGKAVYIGQNAGSDNNKPVIAGTLAAQESHYRLNWESRPGYDCGWGSLTTRQS